MDFLSLFDPTDGNQNKAKKRHKEFKELDNVKKKADGNTKGRRRSRRSNGKNETLPEESSFLCEPDLSTEILVKHGSYIDSYIEINEASAESKTEEKKPKKRHNGRKSRRRKKISPKEPPFEKIYTNNLNNNVAIPKICDENIGKNVNDLKTDDFKANYRIDELKTSDGAKPSDGVKASDGKGFKDRAVYNVIDKLEKVSLKDDMFLAGDFTAQDLESDYFYCSDDDDDYDDDSTSDGEDSCGSVGGSLPPEPRFGNVEYKLRLSAQCDRRFQHLVTQLKWRLVSGGGSCVYVVGVRDCGALVGLSARALRGSLRALRRMAAVLHAHISHLTARRVRAHRAVAEVYIKKLAHPQQSIELRVAVMGANEAGKSTLIGVLTQGELDNGNGSARLNMFRHQHEVKTGMTSSLSHEILGFDAQGNVVNYGCSELMTAERIGERSAKLVSFLDLAGHTKYQRTTRHGLTGYSPHAAMLVISATAGITPITEEHMGILLALRLPFFIVINKCELAAAALNPLLDRLAQMLHHYDKKPLLITDESLARNCCGPQTLILDCIDGAEEHTAPVLEPVAVFPVSCVRGFGLNSLHAHLLALQPPQDAVPSRPEEETCEFQIDEIFHVGDSSDPVVGGLLTRGQLFEGDRLLIGPLDDGSFKLVGVRSIYRNRVPMGCARAGQPASLGLMQPCPPVRPGMVLLAVPAGYKRSKRAVWGGCEQALCKRRQGISDLIRSKQSPIQSKNLRKANKNLLEHLARAEEGLVKEIESKECNLYRESDSDEPEVDDRQSFKPEEQPPEVVTETSEADDECICEDRVLLEDPSDPRGCLFFQATVHLIRHSTAIHPGFQCTVHVGNVRQTAIIEGIMSRGGVVRAGESASALFRFVRCPEYLQRNRQLLLAAGLGTRGIGRITQIFPYVP